MTLEEAETLVLKVLKEVMEEKLEVDNIEISSVSAKTGKFRIYPKEEMLKIIERLSWILPLFIGQAVYLQLNK